jgi:hypothetical protein
LEYLSAAAGRLVEDPTNTAGQITGEAKYIRSDGEMSKIKFRTVAGRVDYEKWVLREIERRGEGVQVSGNDTQSLIQVQAPKSVSGQVTTSWMDLYVAYEDGVMVIGHTKEVHAFPISMLRADIAEAREKAWYARFRPEALPEALRHELLDQFARAAGVNAQGRDGEPLSDVATRRSLYDESVHLLSGVLFDIEECVAWLDTPLPSGAVRGRAFVKAADESRLAGMIAGLRMHRTERDLQRREQDVASLSISAGVPDSCRELLIRALDVAGLPRDGWGSVLRSQIRSGEIELQGVLTETADGAPLIEGAMLAKDLPPGASDLASLLIGQLRGDGSVAVQASPEPGGARLGPQQIVWKREDDWLTFWMSQTLTYDSVDESFAQSRDEPEGPGVRTFGYIACDLGPWADRSEETASSRFLAAIEEATEWALMTHGVDEAILQFIGLNRERSDFRSFVSQIRSGGDWSFELTARSDTRSLSADFVLGKELKELIDARRMTAAVLLNSRVQSQRRSHQQ